MMTRASHRNPEIEALRGVAILCVLYAHLGVYVFFGRDDLYLASREYLQAGPGVHLFFCVSGYVIPRHFAGDFSGTQDARSFRAFAFPFWIRRFWRLMPSAWFWLAVGLALAAIYGQG